MRARRGRSVAALLLLALVIGVVAKKGKKKHKKKLKSLTGATPRASDASYGAAFLQQCNSEKAQIQSQCKSQCERATTQYFDSNKKAVDAHNKLVSEFNALLKKHSELIKRYNSLVGEFQDPSLANFVGAKAIKAYHHPGIEGAVNKTFIHVLPRAQMAFMSSQQQSAVWFNKTQSSVQAFLQAHGGEAIEEWLPAMSGMVVYGSVLIPIAISCWCVLEFVCKLQTLLVFGHVYMAVGGICSAAFAVFTGDDPLSTFAEQDPELYQFAQVGFAMMFLFYGALALFALSCSGSTEWRLLHLVVIAGFGVAYYALVWTPAMVDEMPKVEDFVDGLRPGKSEDVVIFTAAPYLIVAAAFAGLFVFENTGLPAVSPEDAEDKDA